MPSAADSAILPHSSPNLLLRMSHITADCAATVVARSYAGYAWEGVPPTPLHPNCTEDVCMLGVASASEVGASNNTAVKLFRIDAIARAVRDAPTETKAVGRLLLQGTFGTTNSELEAALNGVSGRAGSSDTDTSLAVAWLQAQLAEPATLLRAHYRKRTNPRVFHDAFIGTTKRPCDLGARWNRWAIDRLDVGQVRRVTVLDNNAERSRGSWG